LLVLLLLVGLGIGLKVGMDQQEVVASNGMDVGSGELAVGVEAMEPPIFPADGFDFPVGPPDAKKYYNAQGFQKNNHLGEDWNGVGGGNTDKGDPVHAVAHGRVIEAADAGPGWGNVVRIRHNIGTEERPQFIESLYAHLDQMKVKEGDDVRRGQSIGTIGDAHGAYWAHLHLEMRWKADMPLGGGYSTDTTGFLVPTTFIRSHRKLVEN
jgi:murein DD-endopeptidase MepM/ murein hydrolase activator NlpD